ncbi:MAG: PAS domain S-box protein [Desulfobacteraceae bacterium]|nr:MAG: PAS domain S-box protein [Desulfobacteraceae bacterium]
MIITAVITIALLLQLAAAAFALRLMRITERRPAWALLCAALVLMAVRQGLTLLGLARWSAPPDLQVEIAGLAVSLLVLAGIAGVASLFRTMRQKEEVLRRSEKKYRELYDQAPDMYYSLDRDGAILDCNETTAQMLGYQKQELVGRPLTDFMSAAFQSDFRQTFLKLSENRQYRNLEREFVRRDGTLLPVILNVFGELDASGNLVRTKTIARDISERKQAEKRLRDEALKTEKLEAIGVLAGGIAHDFNNLLTAILGNINLAKRLIKENEPVLRRLDDAEKASLRAKELTAQLLTFAQGGAPVRKTTVLGELIRDFARFAARGSTLRCEFDLPDGLWRVDIDAGQINQAMHHLIINAAQAMPEGGTVTISGENFTSTGAGPVPLVAGPYVKITIADQGVGIPSEHQSKIFDPYFSTKHKGSGLGLATVYSIVKRHGGYITVESELGRGAAFHLYLPAAEEGPFGGDKPVPIFSHAGTGKVLVMDDEEEVRKVAGKMLQVMGYDVDFAGDGVEAIEMYTKSSTAGEPFSAVILDLTVSGGMGGKKAMEQLLKIDPHVRAIVSSGYANDPVMTDYRQHGFKGFVAKPYRVQDLSKTLHEVITHRQRSA